MQHIVKQIKTVTKKYQTKSGEKESVSKRVDIGVTDLFEDGEFVVVIAKSNFDKINNDSTDVIANLEKDVADKDAIIDVNNKSIAKFKTEIETKTNIIGDLSKEIKALKSTVDDLKSDISAKDDKIAELESTEKDVAELEKTIVDNDETIGKLTATVDELKPLLLAKDSTIADLEKEIAKYNAVDVDKLKEKADELDKSKNIIILQQKQITEYIQLVSYHKEKATAYKNQNPFSKLIGRDATADIISPDLALIDLSGNPIADDNADADGGNEKN